MLWKPATMGQGVVAWPGGGVPRPIDRHSLFSVIVSVPTTADSWWGARLEHFVGTAANEEPTSVPVDNRRHEPSVFLVGGAIFDIDVDDKEGRHSSASCEFVAVLTAQPWLWPLDDSQERRAMRAERSPLVDQTTLGPFSPGSSGAPHGAVSRRANLGTPAPVSSSCTATRLRRSDRPDPPPARRW